MTKTNMRRFRFGIKISIRKGALERLGLGLMGLRLGFRISARVLGLE